MAVSNEEVMMELYAMRKENREIAKMVIATVVQCANPDAPNAKVMDIAEKAVKTCWVK